MKSSRPGSGALSNAVRAWALAAIAGIGGGCTADGDGLYGSVHGTVRDAASGKSLRGVDVVFVSDALESAEDTSDGEGRFSINVSTTTANGRLTARKSGYATTTVSVFLDDGDVKVDIELDRE